MSDVIEVRGLRVSAVVGVLAEERTRPQTLLIDLDVERPVADAARSDDLGATTNYAAVIDVAERVAVEGGFLLLETLAHRVASEVLALDDAVHAVTVSVRKARPPVAQDVASVGVRTTVRR